MQTHAWLWRVCNWVLILQPAHPQREHGQDFALKAVWFSDFRVHDDHLEGLLNH